MTAIRLREAPEGHTSAVGSMYGVALEADLAALLIATTLPGSATANTYTQGSMAMWASISPCGERTAAGPIGQIDFVPAESTAEAIMEIRRRSGLTWEELGDLFEVSRRSVHHWANGKPVSAKHDRFIRRMLAAVRRLDQGERNRTRALFMSVDQAMGVSTFDLLREGGFDEAMRRVDTVPAAELHHTPLSNAAWETRRPPAPARLLEAEQERPVIPAKARAVRPRRTPKTAD